MLKIEKSLKNSRKIHEKSLNLEIEYLTKYNSFSMKFSPLDQEFNHLSFDKKISKTMRKKLRSHLIKIKFGPTSLK